MSKTVLAIISARGGSKEVPRKNLRLLADKPLVMHMFEKALASKKIDRVVCSTDDEEIAEVAQKAGVAEHFEARGKHNFAFCERGVVVPHTHNVDSRTILDIQAICALKEYAPSVPVIIDPSHSTFKWEYVSAMSMAAIAAGADGLLIEVHHSPEQAWVDPLNAVGIEDFSTLLTRIRGVAKVIGRIK